MHVAIVGNGITGVAAALRIRERQPDWKITLISGESTYHYSRPALMYLFMGHMKWEDVKPYPDDLWPRQRIGLVRDWVTGIDPAGKRLRLHRGPSLAWDRLLLATGSKSNRFGWPGQDLDGVHGLYDLMDLQRLTESCARARRAVIVGGGLIGVELGEMLHSRGIDVTFLIREEAYWDNVLPREEAELVSRHIEARGFRLIRKRNLERIEDDGNGRAAAVVDDAGERLPCEIVGLTPGVSPNTDLVRATEIGSARGILVDHGFRTSAPDVYAAGDCAEMVTGGDRNLIQQVWYTGRMQGEAAGDAVAGEEVRYEPRLWYNSAKFLDLEYQVYGDVPNRPREGETHLYWEHPDGSRSVRLVTQAGRVTGVNVMGIRYRQEVCERWIREEQPVAQVIDGLGEANFDPELHRRFEGDVRAAFEGQLRGESLVGAAAARGRRQ
ncbi:MAG TPA: FAD-dependent oxidoreductase [bacterium]|nr:FAD-dependent oxidoreductase [bacterium]